jgi:DNA replication ATP-dependent helicase Dna2
VQSEQSPQTRKSVLDLVQKHRIIVGTVASISGKPELFKLKVFERAVIDEASQIPEPMLIGLLTRFAHVTLIGDHKQLPAVVAQPEAWSAVEDAALNELGVHNLRNSLFERLYRRCQAKGWEHAYACLSHQGRMHQAIMAFPNRFFYEGRLQTLPEGNAGFFAQVARELFPQSVCTNAFEAALAQNRMIFVPVPSEPGPGTKKTNVAEAEAAARICIRLKALYGRCGRTWQAGSLGVITPYRAQIAQIRHALQSFGFEGDYPTIDTVERYQGGARDAIVLSLCAHSERQLRSIGSFSEEGVDRKLNVALTRARELLIVLGDPEVLSKVELYRNLISNCLLINNL